MLEIAIVGGGLCGLALANALQAQGIGYAVFEGRTRLGGRIHSVKAQSNGLALDMGAAWFWPRTQPRVTRLVQDLGLACFPQHDTGKLLVLNDPEVKPTVMELEDLHSGAQRIAGGASALIDALAGRLESGNVHLGFTLVRLADLGSHLLLTFRHEQGTLDVLARQVVLALPPRLVESCLDFEPPLNGQLRETLRETPTWMAGNAKALAAFGRDDGMDEAGIDRAAFWREDGHSGNAVASHPRAVLGEIHDACDAIGARAALSGFFALSASVRGAFRPGLPLLVRSQLAQIFGTRTQEAEIQVHDWAEEPLTCASLDRQPVDGHPAYANTLLQVPIWNGRLHFGGSETAAYGGGYMEGALEAAARLRREILATCAILAGPARAEATCVS